MGETRGSLLGLREWERGSVRWLEATQAWKHLGRFPTGSVEEGVWLPAILQKFHWETVDKTWP